MERIEMVGKLHVQKIEMDKQLDEQNEMLAN